MSDHVQLEGYVKIGPVGGTLVDYSAEVTAALITVNRQSITTPPTFADAEESLSAGARTRALQLGGLMNPLSATSLWAELVDAVETDSSELAFEIQYQDAAISPTNPAHKGTFIVMSMETGGTVGDNRAISVTYPIKRGTYVKDTTP